MSDAYDDFLDPEPSVEDPTKPVTPNPEPERLTMPKFLGFSKTFLANAALTVVSVLTALQGQEWVVDHPQLIGVIGAIVGVANVVLRLVTSQPVTINPKS